MKRIIKRKNLPWMLGLSVLLFIMVIWVAFSGSGNGPKANLVYRIARDPIWNPIDFMGKEREVTAFSDELIRSIADEAGLRVSFASTGANALLGGLMSDQFDVILTGIPPSPSVEAQFLYSHSYYPYGPVVVVPEYSSINNLKELEGKVLGVEIGAISHVALDTKTTLISYDNILDGLDAMSRNEIDGVVLNTFPAYFYAQSLLRGNVKVISSPLSEDGLRLVAERHKPGARFIEEFNKGLKTLKTDGRYDALLKRWGLPNAEKEE